LLRWTPDDWQRYLAFCDYIPQAERQQRALSGDAPVALARYRLGQAGYLIARKTLTGRPGTFFVHAIIDAHGVVDPLDVAASEGAAFWVTSEDGLEPAQRALERFDVTHFGEAARIPQPPDPALLARFAGAWANRRILSLECDGADAVAQVHSLLRWLPASVRATLAFSTYEAGTRPGVIDIVGSRQPAPAASTVPDWVHRALALDPETLDTIRDDPRVTDLGGYVAAVDAIAGPLTAAALEAAVNEQSPALERMIARPELREALLEAIDARADWWRGVGLSRVLALEPDLGPAGRILEAAAHRHANARLGPAGTLVWLYQRLQPDLEQRLADLEALPHPAHALGPALLSDQRSVPDDVAAAWEPWLAADWDRLGAALRNAGPALRPRLLRRSIIDGEPGAPSVGTEHEALVLDVVAELARDERYAVRAATFLLGWVRDAHALAGALRADLPAPFVRGPLAERLAGAPELLDTAVRGELIRAGLADHAAFRRLIAEPPRGSALPAADAPRSKGLWGRKG
jgi:hypothetical protein